MLPAPVAIWAAVLLVVLPLLLAPAAYLAGNRLRTLLVWVAPGVMAAILVTLGWEVVSHGPFVYQIGGWPRPLGIAWKVDGLTIAMLAVGVAVIAAVCVYASAYFAGSGTGSGLLFWPLTYWLWASLNALFLSHDVFNLYVTLELLTLSSVGLIVLAGTTQAIAAALRYLLLGLLGSLCYLMGVALLYGAYGVLDMDALAEAVVGDLPSWTAMSLMVVGLLIKTALFPMHFWLPPAHASAPTPVSALLSALVVKASFYLLLRLWFEVFFEATQPLAAQLLGFLGACAVCWGSVQAMRAERLKTLVAYSTVAQLGFLFLIFPLASTASVATMARRGGLLLVLSHALAKAGLFLAAGRIGQIGGDDRLDRLKGIGQHAPFALSATALAGVSLMGLPPSGGFAGKWLLLMAGLESGQWWWSLVLIAGGLLTAAYMFRFWRIAIAGSGEPKPGFVTNWRMELPAFTLAAAAVLLVFLTKYIVALLEIGVPLAIGGPGGALP